MSRGSTDNQPKAAAFFDLDKTVIAKSSTLAFSRPFYKAGLLNKRTLLKAGVAQIVYRMVGADHEQLEKMRNQLMNLTKGWDATQIRQLVRETVDEVVSPLVYAEALAIMDEHRREGRKVVIISASPDEVVKPLARYLGVDHVIATRSKVDSEGRYAGELEFYAYGPGKADAINELARLWNLDLSECYAYSDSETDMPMMEAVGNPVAVNPDKELREAAEENGWPIMEFDRPVTLRTRLADLPKPDPMISGAALATAAAGALTLWYLKTRKRAA